MIIKSGDESVGSGVVIKDLCSLSNRDVTVMYCGAKQLYPGTGPVCVGGGGGGGITSKRVRGKTLHVQNTCTCVLHIDIKEIYFSFAYIKPTGME